MKTSTATIACLAAALFLSGSSLMAHGDCRHHDGPSVLAVVAHTVKHVVREIVRPTPPCRPVYVCQPSYRQAEALRIRELQLQRQLAATRALQARAQMQHNLNRRGCSVRPAHGQGHGYANGRLQAFNDRW